MQGKYAEGLQAPQHLGRRKTSAPVTVLATLFLSFTRIPFQQ